MEPHREVAEFLELGIAIDDSPFLVARRGDEIRFVHRGGDAKVSTLSLLPAEAPGEAVLVYRGLREAEFGDETTVEVARGPEAEIRAAFERFSAGWRTQPAPSARLPLALLFSTALNAALILRLLFG
jgi:hypothetical protein